MYKDLKPIIMLLLIGFIRNDKLDYLSALFVIYIVVILQGS